MTSKLGVNAAIELVRLAREQVVNSNGQVRFGQALWNKLPREQQDSTVNTPLDFFYWLDDERVLKTFYDKLVET